jgi:hypothetical protein
MARHDDDFDGIDISGPWGGVRIGSGMRGGGEWDEDDDVRRIRRKVRRQLEFWRHLGTYVVVVGGLALLDWATGGGFWVQWVAAIWGAFLLLQFLTTFVTPNVWGRGVEERMVQRELAKRRGTIDVRPPPRTPDA